MRMQTWSCRALFGAGLLMLSGSLAQASPPHPAFFQLQRAEWNPVRGAARESWRQ